METQTTPAPGAGSPDSPKPQTPDLVGLAANLAAKHQGSGGKPSPAPAGGNGSVKGCGWNGGRRTAEEEARAYLAKHNLKAVPLGGLADAPVDQPIDVAPPAPAYCVDPAFVKSCTETLLKGVEAWRQGMVYRKALDIAEDKGLAKNLSEEAGAPPGAIQVMALCCAELTQKYDFLGAATPEALLIVAGTVWIAKDLTLIKKLNDLAALKEEAKHPQAQKPPEPKP